jgi:hypothetical protein
VFFRCVANAANPVVTAFPDARWPSQNPAKADALSMLPGFRFLLTAIVVSMSILVFGLGAAALLRAAHEEFASNSSWRAAPPTAFAQQSEAAGPVLALLRVEPPVDQKAPDPISAAAAPAPAAPVEPQESDTAVPAPEPARVAALKPEEPSPPEAAKLEPPAPEAPPPQSETALAQADAPAAASETKITATATAPAEPTEPVPPQADQDDTTAYEPMTVPALPGTKAAPTKVAALGRPSVAVEPPRPAKTAPAKPDASAEQKKLEALRAKRRRIAAARALIARQQAQQPQPANPFAPFLQPVPQAATQPAFQPATR